VLGKGALRRFLVCWGSLDQHYGTSGKVQAGLSRHHPAALELRGGAQSVVWCCRGVSLGAEPLCSSARWSQQASSSCARCGEQGVGSVVCGLLGLFLAQQYGTSIGWQAGLSRHHPAALEPRPGIELSQWCGVAEGCRAGAELLCSSASWSEQASSSCGRVEGWSSISSVMLRRDAVRAQRSSAAVQDGLSRHHLGVV
jgi:hypothetical protein